MPVAFCRTLTRACCISLEAMLDKRFKHLQAKKVLWKLHLFAQKPGIDLGNPWVTLGDANAQN
ncbi:MAG: hypothetical protein F6K41_28680 [Symploca sp. SIO3E6]|nr:hypothetical protein [Caldora sp. SIO3E6]